MKKSVFALLVLNESGGEQSEGLAFTDNVIYANSTEPMTMEGAQVGTAALAAGFLNPGAPYDWGHNLIIPAAGVNEAAAEAVMPTGDTWAPSEAAVGFANPAAGDYTITNPAYKGIADDGTDPGVNMVTLDAATANTLTGGASSSTPPATPTSSVSVYVSPTAANFGSQQLDGSSASQDISLVNATSSAITVSSVTITGDYSIQTNSCNTAVQANTHCDVYVVFKPTADGTRTGVLTFTENNSGGSVSQTVSLTGVGEGTVSAPVPVPSPGAPQTLTALLVSSPSSGLAPLTVSLTATADGSAQGTVNYIFYCNRTDAGTGVTSPTSLTINASVARTYTATKVCSYSAPGSYTAKVIIEEGAAPPAQAQQIIIVNTASPISNPISNPTPPIVVATTTPISTTTTPIAFPHTLKLGESGNDVMLLQVVLKNLGFFPQTFIATDYFGSLTQHALLLFQNAHLLVRTGLFDVPTQTLMNKVIAADPTLTQTQGATQITSTPSAVYFSRGLGVGDTGADVGALQTFLIDQATGPAAAALATKGATAYFGSLTEDALKEFQEHADITPASGYFGVITKAYVNAIEATKG